jgi:hypothetical protein
VVEVEVDLNDIRTALAVEIRDRADSERRLAEHHAKSADEGRELAEVLDMLAQKLERGEVDEKVGELLRAARPSPVGPFMRFGQEEETELALLRRVFNLG